MSPPSKGRGNRPAFTDQEALLFHSQGRPGKLEIVATKPMATQRDLSLAYSPGVAVPVLAIAENEALAYDYTTKGNFVAVITNGTAILGLGNLGALASKGSNIASGITWVLVAVVLVLGALLVKLMMQARRYRSESEERVAATRLMNEARKASEGKPWSGELIAALESALSRPSQKAAFCTGASPE